MLHKQDIKTIAIFRALQLGDLLCSVPAFRALRNSFPEARISIIGLPWMKMFTDRFSHYLDDFILFPGYPGLPEQEVHPEETLDFLSSMVQRKFELALQMQGNGSIVNPMVELFNARFTAGFCRKQDYCPDTPLFMEYPEQIPEVRRHLLLMQHLGIAAKEEELEFPITKKDEEDLNESSLAVNPKEYICVHAGSRGAWRQWPTAYFSSVADHCSQKGWKIVLTGTKEELPIVEEVAANMLSKPLIAAGKTNLGALAVLLRNSAGLISNCTGVSHIAAALKVKSVVISMDGEPERWAPLNRNIHSTIDWTRNSDYDAVRRAVDERFSLAS
jgi:ADP-heptose:LPS heptosyltransferase